MLLGALPVFFVVFFAISKRKQKQVNLNEEEMKFKALFTSHHSSLADDIAYFLASL